jgi:levansucrase
VCEDLLTKSAISVLDANARLQLRLTPSRWLGDALRGIDPQNLPCPPVYTKDDVHHVDPAMTLWDIWPIQLDNGDLAHIDQGSLWVMLSAPRSDDPDVRHDQARMRLLLRSDETWIDCGHLLPEGLSPGSREWSGSTRLDPRTGEVTLWFTAAGRRGETRRDFEQRLFHTQGRLDTTGPLPRFVDWTAPTQSVVNSGEFYADLMKVQGELGHIKGFRDPYWFRDPADGQGYLLFTASMASSQSSSRFDGVIGIARAGDPAGHLRFELEAPILDGYGLASELERPHMFVKDGLYYLFWSTAHRIFNTDGPTGPTGLYGMVGPSLFGPFEPLNATSLVLSNPAEEPHQAYAWQVLPNLDVVSFVDFWGLKGRDPKTDPALASAQFGGSIAPITKIAVEGKTTRIIKA